MLLGPVMTPTLPYPFLDHANSANNPQYPGLLPSSHMPASKRPKLSLQTSHLSTTYGASSTKSGVRKETLSTTTPTTLNTISNTYDLTFRPSPNSATTSPAPLLQTRSACISPYARRRPYDLNLPFGKRPILKNSSLGQQYRANLTSSASPRYSRKTFFPAPQRVSFEPIEEEIVTHVYVARHVDLSSSEDDEDEIEMSPSKRVRRDVDQQSEGSESTISSPRQGQESLKRTRSTSSRTDPARRTTRKKRRWEWTLGDLAREEAQTLASTTAEEVLAEAEAEVQRESEAEKIVTVAPIPDAEAASQQEPETEKTETGAPVSDAAGPSAEDLEEPASSPDEFENEATHVWDDGEDSDWETVTSSTVSTPQNISPAKLVGWEDPTLPSDLQNT